MKPSNYQQPNLPHGKSIFSLFRYAIVAILIFSFILITSDRSYAEDPSAAIIRPFGDKIVVREGTNRNVTPWKRDRNGDSIGELRRFKDTLEIPGDNKSKANLSFISENTVLVEYARLIISTVPSSDNTEYRFPCGLSRGSVTIGWRKAEDGRDSRDRACNEGISVGPGVGKLSYRPNLNYRDGLQASKKILLAQSFSDVIIVPPDSGSRFLQAVANENGAEIITLQGDILVKSGKHLQGRLIPEGNKYSYPQDTITPIDKNSIINSPAVQDFFNPNNWRSPDIPQRVADGIAGQLGEMRTALGLGSPAVASNSGNNNNSGQSSTANSNNIAITSGSGRITNSQYPTVVPVGTSVSQVSGAYNPSTGKILLEIEGRQAEISLNAPLTDGTPIPFTVTGTRSRGYDPATKKIYGSQYSRLTTGGIKAGVKSQGTLIKQGNQIQGKFTARGVWYVLGKSANTGSVDGEFTLNLQPGVSANTPVYRIIPPRPDDIDTSIPGGW